MSESPLLILTIISFCFIALGVCCGLYLLYLSATGTPVSGRPLIQFSMLSVIVGFFMLVFGFLAHQNKQLERQLHRLQYEITRQKKGMVKHYDANLPLANQRTETTEPELPDKSQSK